MYTQADLVASNMYNMDNANDMTMIDVTEAGQIHNLDLAHTTETGTTSPSPYDEYPIAGEVREGRMKLQPTVTHQQRGPTNQLPPSDLHDLNRRGSNSSIQRIYSGAE